jgi:hypothetical protein
VRLGWAAPQGSPHACASGPPFRRGVRIENRSRAPIEASAVPVRRGTIHLSYALHDANGESVGLSHRTRVPAVPAASSAAGAGVAEAPLLIVCPARPGIYRLDVALVQEGYVWQDAVLGAAPLRDRLRVLPAVRRRR